MTAISSDTNALENAKRTSSVATLAPASASGLTVVVYTIVKDAEPYIVDWIESARHPQSTLVLGDTGSTDRTVAVARKHGALVFKIKPEVPFHFGNARNLLLDKLPDADVFISLDADEVLVSGWMEALEREWNGGVMLAELRNSTESRCKDGNAASVNNCYVPRIHDRSVRWKYRIHETLCSVDNQIGQGMPSRPDDRTPQPIEHTAYGRVSGVIIEHRKDRGKKRNYVELLRMQLEEVREQGIHSPVYRRTLAYLTKELFAAGNKNEAIAYGNEYLSLSSIENKDLPDVAAIANVMYYATLQAHYLYKSIHFFPQQQEAYCRLAEYMYHNKDWIGVYHFCSMTLEYPPARLFSEQLLSDELLRTLLAEAAFQTGRNKEAIEHCMYLTLKYPNNNGHAKNLARYSTPLI